MDMCVKGMEERLYKEGQVTVKTKYNRNILSKH